MQVLLKISNGKSNVRNVRLKSDTVIGRSPECQLKVASNQISRRHCQILLHEYVVAIKDLGSANGTFVNGRQIPAEVEIPLTPGTRVMLGPLQFTVDYEIPGAVKPAAAPVSDTPTPPMGTAPTPIPAEPNYDTVNTTVAFTPQAAVTPTPAVSAQPAFSANAATASQVTVAQTPTAPVYPAPMAAPVAAAQQIAPPVPIDEAEGIPDFSSPFDSAGQVADDSSPATVIAASPFRDFAPPEVFGSAPAASNEVDPGNFNFGIFASSGSGIIVEDVPQSAGVADTARDSSPDTGKAKKGLLSMFGWGKKKPASPAVTPKPDVSAEQAEVPPEAAAVPAGFVDAGETISFQLPSNEEQAEGDGPDPSLQEFFNKFE